MDEYYIPMLEKYAYHLPHVILLGKNETSADRSKNLQPGDIETSRDYAERLVFEKGKEIMSQHFGSHPSLSMEGVGLRYFPLEEVDKYYKNNDMTAEIDQTLSKKHFHSHLADISLQNAASTHHNMCKLLDILQEKNIIRLYSTLFCNTDGCSKQYRCAVAMYFLSLLATRYTISIERLIGAPGHGKGYVDGLNAVDKQFLKRIMMLIKTPTEENSDVKKISMHTVKGEEHHSHAKECAKLLSEDRSKCDKKGKKQGKIEDRNYHVTDKDTLIKGSDLKMKAKGFHTAVKGELYTGLRAHYHIHADPDLGVGKVAVRRIPCGCTTCLQKLRTKWDRLNELSPEQQPRFARNENCKYSDVFGIYNDWTIIHIDKTKDNDNDDLNDVNMEVLDSILMRISSEIKVSGIGAYMKNPECNDDYIIVKWDSLPYAVQKGDEKPNINIGDVVVNTTKLNCINGTNNWFVIGNKRKIVKLSSVLHGNIKFEELIHKPSFPQIKNRKKIMQKDPIKMDDECHETILDAIYERQHLMLNDIYLNNYN